MTKKKRVLVVLMLIVLFGIFYAFNVSAECLCAPECVAGQIELGASCAQCATFQRQCQADCTWSGWTCVTNEGGEGGATGGFGGEGLDCNCGPCGCGGTYQCDGTCSGPNPAPEGFGTDCDCNSNGCGTIQCDGRCGSAPPQGCSSTGVTCQPNACGAGTLDSCGNCNNVPIVPLNYGGPCQCDCNNNCGTWDCFRNCVNAPSPCPTSGGVNLVATLDGSSVSTSINFDYYKNGVFQANLEVPVPRYSLTAESATYRLEYMGGGPLGATYIGTSPSSEQYLPPGDSIIFSFDFVSPQGTLNVRARTSDGNSWSGSISGNYCSTTSSSCTPNNAFTIGVPFLSPATANKRYVLSYTSGGPVGTTFAGITTPSSPTPTNPSAPQYLNPSSSITYTYNFNCNSAQGQTCTRCGTIDCYGTCSLQGECDPGTTKCSNTYKKIDKDTKVVIKSKFQTCSSACNFENSGTDADLDEFDVQCGDGFCDMNASFIDSNRTCTPGQTRCFNGRYQTCPSCDWKNSGTDADGDGVDKECGDSLCDNNPSVTDSTAPCTTGTQCLNGEYQACVNCGWVTGGTDADADGVARQCEDSLCDKSKGVCNVAVAGKCIGKTPTETICDDTLDNDCDTFTDCLDFNCNGTIIGTVSNTNFQPIASADVTAKGPRTLTTIISKYTDIAGAYGMGIRCGTWNLVAAHPNYIPNTKSVNVPPMQTVTADFFLTPGSLCEEDCTYINDDIIHSECDNTNNCKFCDERTKEVCDFAKPGWIRDYSDTHYVICAKECPQPKTELAASATCESGTLVKVTRIVVYNGKPVKLVVATCG